MSFERDRPRAHLVVDDFFSEAALATVFAEIAQLDCQMKPGLVRDFGHDGQSVFFAHPRRKNQAVWVHEPSKTLRLFREHLWSERLLPAFDTAREPLFQIIPSCHAPNLQVSRYMTGDHYDFHEDEGAGVNLTVIVFLARNPSKVRGGDLVLAYGGEDAKIRFRHNRLVVFPSKTLHRVTRVRVDGGDPRDARISLQSWLAHGRPLEKAKPRKPEADRPTFLLAEEPIIAAAQAMLASRAQSTEELYWGAFYVSRILSQNLRCLAADVPGLVIGQVRVRRHEELEIYAGGRMNGGAVRIGFCLRGGVSPAEALDLFVENGRGAEKSTARRRVPPGAGERESVAILRRLLPRLS